MRQLKTYSDNSNKLEFGDYILFQEYTNRKIVGDDYQYKISKPIFGIYLGGFIADQAFGFNYVKWINEKRIVYITNENVTNYPKFKEVKNIDKHIEWYDYIDILGIWKNKPNWKQILSEYRKQNDKTVIQENEFEI